MKLQKAFRAILVSLQEMVTGGMESCNLFDDQFSSLKGNFCKVCNTTVSISFWNCLIDRVCGSCSCCTKMEYIYLPRYSCSTLWILASSGFPLKSDLYRCQPSKPLEHQDPSRLYRFLASQNLSKGYWKQSTLFWNLWAKAMSMWLS